jgi:hypothetical protein
VAISGSRQTDQLFRLASSRVPLHRVVLGEPSIRSGHPLPEGVMLPGRCGRTPTRIARRLTRRRQLTRAMTDSHRAAQPTRLATGASTQLQLLSGLNPGSPSRYQPGPATLPPSRSRSSAELRLPDHGREEIGILHRGREDAERLASRGGGSWRRFQNRVATATPVHAIVIRQLVYGKNCHCRLVVLQRHRQLEVVLASVFLEIPGV